VARYVDLRPRCNLERHSVGEFRSQHLAAALNCIVVRVEREDVAGVAGDERSEPTVTAAHFEDALPAEVGEPSQGRDMRPFGVEDPWPIAHPPGLYAFSVVP
jgi:hypothetical protein